jgi:hypothetical protein
MTVGQFVMPNDRLSEKTLAEPFDEAQGERSST